MKINNIFLLLIILFITLLSSCAPKPFEPFIPPEIKFDKTPNYSIEQELVSIPKPEKLKPLYVNLNSNTKQITFVSSPKQANYILLAPQEYAKISALLKLTKSYKTIILDQDELINIHISQINNLKELFAMEQQKSISYRELWVNAENLYRQEKYDHQVDNIINKSVSAILFMGSIALFAIGL